MCPYLLLWTVRERFWSSFLETSPTCNPVTLPLPRQPLRCQPLGSEVLHSQWCRRQSSSSSVMAESQSPSSLLHQWRRPCCFMDFPCVLKHHTAQLRSDHFCRLRKRTVPGNQRQQSVPALVTLCLWGNEMFSGSPEDPECAVKRFWQGCPSLQRKMGREESCLPLSASGDVC